MFYRGMSPHNWIKVGISNVGMLFHRVTADVTSVLNTKLWRHSVVTYFISLSHLLPAMTMGMRLDTAAPFLAVSALMLPAPPLMWHLVSIIWSRRRTTSSKEPRLSTLYTSRNKSPWFEINEARKLFQSDSVQQVKDCKVRQTPTSKNRLIQAKKKKRSIRNASNDHSNQSTNQNNGYETLFSGCCCFVSRINQIDLFSDETRSGIKGQMTIVGTNRTPFTVNWDQWDARRPGDASKPSTFNFNRASIWRLQLTGYEGKSLHGRKRMIPRCVENIQLVDFAADAVNFPVKVLNGRSVRVVELVVQEPKRQQMAGCNNHGNKSLSV